MLSTWSEKEKKIIKYFTDYNVSWPEPKQSSSIESVTSSCSTILYADNAPFKIAASVSRVSTISLYSDDDDEEVIALETHHFVPDGPPAPFSESFEEGDL